MNKKLLSYLIAIGILIILAAFAELFYMFPKLFVVTVLIIALAAWIAWIANMVYDIYFKERR